jgi:hypothetical protein
MRVIHLWLTVIVLALSNRPAVAMVLDVDDPSKHLFSALIMVLGPASISLTNAGMVLCRIHP